MQPNNLISVKDLKARLHDPKLRIIDARFSLADTEKGRNSYLNSHIPGALYAHLDEDLSSPIVPRVSGRHPLPDVNSFVEKLCNWGIDAQTSVVIYDDMGGAIAARAWWMLRWLGHDKVAVLDGAWQGWCAEAAPTTDVVLPPNRVQFTPKINNQLFMDEAAIELAMAEGSIVLVDSRGRDRYCGAVEPIDKIAGHIPGALNFPYPENLDESGVFHTPERLAQRFGALRDKGSLPVVFYCGSGVTAAHNILAFAQAGLGEALLYPGSWSGWIAPGTRPVARGNQPAE